MYSDLFVNATRLPYVETFHHVMDGEFGRMVFNWCWYIHINQNSVQTNDKFLIR